MFGGEAVDEHEFVVVGGEAVMLWGWVGGLCVVGGEGGGDCSGESVGEGFGGGSGVGGIPGEDCGDVGWWGFSAGVVVVCSSGGWLVMA